MALPKEADLQKMTVKELRNHIKQMNEHYAIRGYYKMNKDQLINAIGTAHMRIAKGSAGHPEIKPLNKKAMPKKSMPKGKSILESKVKQKPGRPAKTSTATGQQLKKSY